MTAEEILRRALRLLDVELPPTSETTSARTVRDIVTQAMRDVGILAAGETAEADDADDALLTLQNLVDAWADEGVAMGFGTLTLATVFSAPVRVVEAVQAALAARLANAAGREGAPAWQAVNATMLRRAKAHYRALRGYDALNDMLAEWETQGVRLGDLTDTTLVAATEVPVPSTHRNAIIYGLALRVAPTIPVEPPQNVAMMAARAYAALRAQYMRVPIMRGDPALVLAPTTLGSGGDPNAISSDSGPLYP